MPKKKKTTLPKKVEALFHKEDKRKNIPTAEHQSVMEREEQRPKQVRYPRNTDLDPQLVWRGKDEQDYSDLVVPAPPVYIQEKVTPKAVLDELVAESRKKDYDAGEYTPDLFADFNGLPKGADKTDFYKHDQNWSNRMILGDSLQVMASLAEREGLRGKVQCIYFDPPYGIKFNSNFQWSTTSRDVKDGKADHITREPEQVKAFRDTWRDGIHSYLTYLRDRLTVARDLLTESGSIFVQIGDENVHRVRAILDEIYGEENFVAQIWFRKKTMPLGANLLEQMGDWILHYARKKEAVKYRPLLQGSIVEGDNHWNVAVYSGGITKKLANSEINNHASAQEDFDPAQLISMSPIGYSEHRVFPVRLIGKTFQPAPKKSWKTDDKGMQRLGYAGRLVCYEAGERLRYLLRHSDYPTTPISTSWSDTSAPSAMNYVVETSTKPIQRCILMSTDPGDLVLDPTCGSGTTAYVAEQWGRRWITVDTSRVALALARTRIMGARYPYYLLADSGEGQQKEAELAGKPVMEKPSYGNIHHGFVYERVPHVTLKSIANNAEIDVIWEQWQPKVQAALADLNKALKGHKTPFKVSTGGRAGKEVKFDAAKSAAFDMPSGDKVPACELVEWEVPREAPADWPKAAAKPFADFWQARIARQKEMDASIAAKAEYEYLYDKAYEEKKKVRVAGPFTVESLSPHRMLGVDENDELIDPLKIAEAKGSYDQVSSFEHMVFENLKTAGVQQAHKQDKIDFESLVLWPGHYIAAEGKYRESGKLKRAGVFLGPEFGTVTRVDLVDAAREAAEAGFDVVIACAFNFEAHAEEFNKLGRIPVLKARMNADLHMAEDLKSTGKGNLFVIFGEPDIELLPQKDKRLKVKVKGVDVFDPSTGEVRSDGADTIACWFVDTDYNGESFFVRQAYFLGQNDPYKALKTTLKAEINAEAWESLNSDVSRAFEKPKGGRIAVKVINHLGDEVMRVFRV